MVLTASVAGADTWTSQLSVLNDTSWINVVTTATNMGDHWNWTYALTPEDGATNIRGLTITLGPTDVAVVSNVTAPTGWSGLTSGDSVYWQTPANGPNTLDAGDTFTYGFDDPWGPSLIRDASAMDEYGYSGPVHGPVAVPEPMGVVVCITGMGSLVGFRKLRRK